jgi:outer membrane receptor protein involved in Fe transport
MNIENAASQGVELGWGRKLTDDWTFSYNTIFTDAEDDTTGNRLPNSPEWDHRVALNYSKGDFSGEAFWRNTDSRFTDLANATKAPAFTTFDLHFGWTPGDWEMKVHLLNIFDEMNRQFGPKPGLEWQFEVIKRL